MRESALQERIIRKAEADGWMVIKIIRANVSGLPDLLLLRDGEARFVEVKRPGRMATPLQELMHRRLRAAGFSVVVE
jgi:hypothetical protein